MARPRVSKPGRQVRWAVLLGVALGAACLPGGRAAAQRWHDAGFAYRRVAQLPASASRTPGVVVCQFFAHRAITPSHPAVVVRGRRDMVASQVLQTGPGDLHRVAFQTVPEETRYSIYYGGEPREQDAAPAWTVEAGLLLETRGWRACDLARLDSVRRAFEESSRIGADYVPRVYHRFNPFAAQSAPFLSRYTGQLQVPLTGTCAFYTSSQDCSFLLIDGQVVVASPGRHPPVYVARIRGEATLQQGPHRFEYYHAAAGVETCMVAAWKPPGAESPSPIPATAFGNDRVVHVFAGELEHREQGYQPDFQMAVVGDIPTPEGDTALVRVRFANRSPQQIAGNAKFFWEFGDGQTSEQQNPDHIYLHPGTYDVALRVTRGLRVTRTANAAQVPRHFAVDAKELQQEQKLSDYLAMLDQYDAARLDPVGLTRLVRTYADADQKAKAAAVAKAAFGATAKQTDESRWAIVSEAGPMLRYELDDARGAGEMWYAASRQITRGGWRVACAVEAADILANDLLSAAKAKSLLETVKEQLSEAAPATRGEYYRVLADCLARQGTGDDARAAYRQAEATRELGHSAVERDAWRGAHSRSAEAYLQSGESSRARVELRQWQRDFPRDKCEGYLSLLLMRCWHAARKPAQALAVAADLLAVNASSPYADRVVFLSAECEEQLGRPDRAAAALQSLVTDYPGSPLVTQAKTELQRLRSPGPVKQATVRDRQKTPRSPARKAAAKGKS